VAGRDAESAAAFLAVHLLSRRREPRLPGNEHAAVRKGVAVMRERPAEPITLAGIAAEAHLSPRHFVRVFRDSTGETPYRYPTRLRIEPAQRLLSGTTLTVDVALAQAGDGGTDIGWSGEFAPRPAFSGPLWRSYLTRFVRGMADGLARHVEGGGR
jgi:AraC-like DNA-binding protein